MAGNCSLETQSLIDANPQIVNPDLVTPGTPVCVPSACCTSIQCSASDPTMQAAAPASNLTGMHPPPIPTPPGAHTTSTPSRKAQPQRPVVEPFCYHFASSQVLFTALLPNFALPSYTASRHSTLSCLAPSCSSLYFSCVACFANSLLFSSLPSSLSPLPLLPHSNNPPCAVAGAQGEGPTAAAALPGQQSNASAGIESAGGAASTGMQPQDWMCLGVGCLSFGVSCENRGAGGGGEGGREGWG